MEASKVLIDRLELFAERRPGMYRFRVAALAALGYAYLLLVVLLLLGLVVAVVYMLISLHELNFLIIKVIWIPLVLAGFVLRSLWVSIPEPDGRELKYEDAPRLFDVVKETQRTLSGPPVHHVFLSDELNVSIFQIPQLGMFGWSQNYLVIGLPLLRALSPEEFRAVLAHEFGHLSGKHGRFSGWVYRVRQTWVQLLTRVHQEKQYAAFIFEWFLNWYAPFFNAYSFVLARAQEREADRYSVEIAGKEVTARTLVRIEEKQRAIAEEFWPGLYRDAKEQPQPPRDVFGRMLASVEQSVERTRATNWFVEAIKVKTGYDDTHPALADRLVAIGFDKDELANESTAKELVSISEPGQQSAAAFFLQHLPEDFLDRCDRLWREKIARQWRERHADIKKIRERLAGLEEKSKTAELTAEEEWERAISTTEISDRESALPFIRGTLQKNPEHAGANFALGAILLEQNDELGVEYLEKAIKVSQLLTGPACQVLHDFYFQKGRHEEAEACRERAAKFYKALEKHEQGMNLSEDDRFEQHGLNETKVAEIRSQLSRIAGLSSAYLVKKVFDDAMMPVFVMGVTAGYTFRYGVSEKNPGLLVQTLAANIECSEAIVYVALEGISLGLQKMITGIPGAEIYKRG